MSKTGWQIVAIMLGGVLTILPAHADTFGSGANAFTIDFVTIGNAGNAHDPLFAPPWTWCCGGVDYGYRMGVTEVPQDWIDKATNLGLTNVTAGGWPGQLQPATSMTWYEAAAFVNWLNTSTGHHAAYQLNEANTALTLWGPADSQGGDFYRHRDAYYFLPSENEWYKAAYHRNDGTRNYWRYATGSDSPPTPVASGTLAGTAVYNLPGNGESSPANIDKTGGLSAYGTRGQNGNVYEWMETPYNGGGTNTSGDLNRSIRGGQWIDSEGSLRSSLRFSFSPDTSFGGLGFRVASVPEPSCAMLTLGSGLMLLVQRRRSVRKQHARSPTLTFLAEAIETKR